MSLLAEDKRVLFVGQTVSYAGSAMFDTLNHIPTEQRLEVPIMEDAQLGMCIGLSLEGYIPVCVYPRFDFLLLACNQLVNHLDKYEEMTLGQFKPKVIIRTAIGSKKPLFPGTQHCGDYTQMFASALHHVDIIKIYKPDMVVPYYMSALSSSRSTLLIEIPDLYGEEIRQN